MKKYVSIVTFMTILIVGAAEAPTISIADARGKIGDAVSSEKTMADLTSRLSADDQVSFLGEVNLAVASMPASAEEKVAKSVISNRAAMKAAKTGNLLKLLAEMFATAMPEALTVINERFADELFNRAADPSKTYTDAEFQTIATHALEVVSARCAKLDDAAVRETFAILMFLRASNGTPIDLDKTLVAMLPTDASRELASKEWIPAAMASGPEKSYESLLAAANAGRTPNIQLVLRMAGSFQMEALLSRLTGKSEFFAMGADGTPRYSEDAHIDRVPRTTDITKRWHPDWKRGEPSPYDGQSW